MAFSGNKFVFSLIELLIVISVIAVLAGLLLPALKHSKDMSYRISCASNMKQLGSGYYMYDTDFGRLPAFWDEIYGDGYREPGHYLKRTDSGNTQWLGFGALAGSGIITSGRGFYCPSKTNVNPNGSFRYEGSYANGNGKWRNDLNAEVQVTDNYWQRWNKTTSYYENTTAGLVPMISKLTNNSPNRWLAADMWGYYAVTTDQYWYPHPNGFNILYIDGHAGFIKTSLTTIISLYSGNAAYVCPKLTNTFGLTVP
ncbi:MAG: hypothetical protein A2017_21835 [Lentisphaerae bacterium GWF2_44_16]|nr:MAG: hypothetical protein A2017_21835 [Lentisphaerae bacterium GWF2_44_16]